jgi:hypothetical protein
MKKEEQPPCMTQQALIKLLEMPEGTFNKTLEMIKDFRYVVSTDISLSESMADALTQLLLR